MAGLEALALLLACALSLSSAHAQFVNVTGVWYGSCVQLAASPSGTSASCVEEGQIITYPFSASWNTTAKNTTYQYLQDSVNITDAFGDATSTLGYASDEYAINATLGVPVNGGVCVSAVSPSGSRATFRAYFEHIGSNTIYIEEGMYDTETNEAIGFGCEAMEAPPLFCNATMYNYRCVAYSPFPYIPPM